MNTPQILPPTSLKEAAVTSGGTQQPNFGGAAGNHDRLTEQTRKWVAQTFYGTLLRQMRQSPFRSQLFEGGHGGESFESMLDQRLADHMSRSSGSKLVKAIVNKIEHASAYRAHHQQKTKSKPGSERPATPLHRHVPVHKALKGVGPAVNLLAH